MFQYLEIKYTSGEIENNVYHMSLYLDIIFTRGETQKIYVMCSYIYVILTRRKPVIIRHLLPVDLEV